MKLIYEKNNILAFLYLFNSCVYSFFKIASEFSTRYHACKIQRYYPFILEWLGHITGYDLKCKTFSYRSFTHAGFSDKTRVILCSS